MEDTTFKLCGIEFDRPEKKEGLKKWEYAEKKDGRSIIKELWINSYEKGLSCISRQSYLLTMTNRGKCELEGKVLKGEDLETAKKVFESL